ncbi:hypothetical protein D3C86_1771430 [compost metagenome]
MLWIDVREQSADGDSFDGAIVANGLRDLAHRELIQRKYYLTQGADTFGNFIAIGSTDECLGLDPSDVVVAAAVTTLDKRHIFKAVSGDVGNLRAFSR